MKIVGASDREALSRPPAVLVHLGAGVGNVVLASPLLIALHEKGFLVDVWLAADYAQTADLLQPWTVVRQVFSNAAVAPAGAGYAHIVPAIPPFYWPRFARQFARMPRVVPRPPDSHFYDDEQDFYLSFARTLGAASDAAPPCTLPISPDEVHGVTPQTLVIAPGCKTGEMAAKRWPHFVELARSFEDVVIVGTSDDLRRGDGQPFDFPPQARSFVDRLSLRQTAELLAGAGIVVANDSGLAHVAAAVGAPTVIIFGPTPDRTLGRFPENVTVLRQGLACEPCWFGSRFAACGRRISCLEDLAVETVIGEVERKSLLRAGLPRDVARGFT